MWNSATQHHSTWTMFKISFWSCSVNSAKSYLSKICVQHANKLIYKVDGLEERVWWPKCPENDYQLRSRRFRRYNDNDWSSDKEVDLSIGITVGLRVGSSGLGIFYFVTKLFLYAMIIFEMRHSIQVNLRTLESKWPIFCCHCNLFLTFPFIKRWGESSLE